MKKSKVLLLLAGHFYEDVTRGRKEIRLVFRCCLFVVFMFCRCRYGNGSVAAGWCGFCWVVKTSCVVCFVDAYLLWNFSLDGEQKWKNVDQLGRFCSDMSRDLQQTFKVWLVDYFNRVWSANDQVFFYFGYVLF